MAAEIITSASVLINSVTLRKEALTFPKRRNIETLHYANTHSKCVSLSAASVKILIKVI